MQVKHQAQTVLSSVFVEVAFERLRAAAEITRTEEFAAGGTNCAWTTPSRSNGLRGCGEAWGIGQGLRHEWEWEQ